jgi:serine protease Do
MIVTNAHVVEGCGTGIDVVNFGPAQVLKADRDLDLAVVQLRDTNAQHGWAPIRSTPPELGEEVVLAGYPLADLLNSSLNLSTGIVSSETGGGLPAWFTTNAGIQPGNSGGPVLDHAGLVIGVAVAKLDDVALFADSGVIAPNFGFAIRGEVLQQFVSIFARPVVSGYLPSIPVSRIAREAKRFTVQILCTG